MIHTGLPIPYCHIDQALSWVGFDNLVLDVLSLFLQNLFGLNGINFKEGCEIFCWKFIKVFFYFFQSQGERGLFEIFFGFNDLNWLFWLSDHKPVVRVVKTIFESVEFAWLKLILRGRYFDFPLNRFLLNDSSDKILRFMNKFECPFNWIRLVGQKMG